MAKTKISEYSSTANSNTDIASINIDEGCAPSGINNAIRALMAQLKDFQTGAASDPVTVGGVLTVTGGSASAPAITTSGDTNTGVLFPAADTVGVTTGGTERVRVDSSGNVGIGTSSPASYSGYTVVTLNNATNGGVIDFQQGGTRVGTVSVDNSIFTLGSIANTPTRFLTNGSERARIDSSGNLLVGRTSTYSQYGGRVEAYVDSSVSTTPMVAGVNTTSNRYAIEFYNPNGRIGSIQISGSATTYVTSSDYRLKENIAPMTGALAVVQQLKPCTYTWKVDGTTGQGFIAHELQEVVPDCVTGEKDAVNEDGSVNPQGIDTSFLVATLTAAIQEQQAIIQTLTARIEALEQA